MSLARRWPPTPRGIALALVILLGLGLRLYNLGGPSLWWDEANTMRYSQWATDPAKLLNVEYINEAPLMPLAVAAWNGVINILTGQPLTSQGHDFLLRLLPCLCGMASIPLLYLLALRLSSSTGAALLAALLFAVSPFQIHYAQELRVYSLHTLTGLALCLCLLRVLSGARARWWYGLVLCEALLFYGHYVSVWIIVCVHLFFVGWLSHGILRGGMQKTRAGRLLIQWTAWHLLMLALIAPGLYHAWRCNQMLLNIEFAWYPAPGLRSLYITFKNFYYGYGPTAYIYKPFVVLALAAMGMGLATLCRRQARAGSLLALLVFGPVLLNWAMWRARDFSLYEDRLFILSAALSYIPIAIGLLALRPRFVRIDAVAAFVFLSLCGLYGYYEGALHPLREHRLAICDKVDFRSATRYLETQWQPGDFLAHDSNFTIFPMRYYFPGEQAHLGATPEDAAIYAKAFGNPVQLQNLGALPILAQDAVKDAKRIWYIEAFGVTADEAPQTQSIREWLAERYDGRLVQDFDGLHLYLFVPKS